MTNTNLGTNVSYMYFRNNIFSRIDGEYLPWVAGLFEVLTKTWFPIPIDKEIIPATSL